MRLFVFFIAMALLKILLELLRHTDDPYVPANRGLLSSHLDLTDNMHPETEPEVKALPQASL